MNFKLIGKILVGLSFSVFALLTIFLFSPNSFRPLGSVADKAKNIFDLGLANVAKQNNPNNERTKINLPNNTATQLSASLAPVSQDNEQNFDAKLTLIEQEWEKKFADLVKEIAEKFPTSGGAVSGGVTINGDLKVSENLSLQDNLDLNSNRITNLDNPSDKYDATNKNYVDDRFTSLDLTGLNTSNWNSAFGWGDHASAGYLTSYTETDATSMAYLDQSVKVAATPTFAGATLNGNVNISGNVGVGTTMPTQKLDIEKGNLRFGQVAAPTAPTAEASVAAGNLNGFYSYRLSYVTANGETESGAVSAVVNPVDQDVNLTVPVSNDAAVIARKIYRTGTDLKPITQETEIGGYLPINSNGSPAGAAEASVGQIFLAATNSQIRQKAVVSKIQLWMDRKPTTLSDFKIQIWRRRNAGDGKYDRIYSEDFYSQITTGAGIKTFIPSSTWNVESGDMVGYEYTATGHTTDYMHYANIGGETGLFWKSGDIGTSDIDWLAQSSLSSLTLPIKIYANVAPNMVVFTGGQFQGNSPENPSDVGTVGGVNHMWNIANPSGGPTFSVNRLRDPADMIAQHYGITYQNMTAMPEDVVVNTCTLSRFNTDVVPYNPKIVINDFGLIVDGSGWSGIPIATTLANVRSMLNATKNLGAISIVLLPLPNYKYFSNISMTGVDEIKQAVSKIIQAEYPETIIVDQQLILGTERLPNGPKGNDYLVPGNHWDYAAEYSSDGGDMPNAAGYAKLAEEIIKIIDAEIGKNSQPARLVATIGNNSQTTFTDNIGDESLGAYATAINSTGGIINNGLKNIGIADPQSTAWGQSALSLNSGYENSAVGNSALKINTIGSYNLAVGSHTLFSNTIGNNNTAFGTNALYSNISGSYNTAVGASSGYDMTTGSGNILLGYYAGSNLTSGSNNIVIGYNVNAPTATSSNTLNIGNLIYGTGISGVGASLSSGNLGIGNTAPDNLLAVGTGINPSGYLPGISLGAAASRYITVGQDSTHNLVIGWNYNATVGSAYAQIGTYNGSNALVLQPAGGGVGIGTTNIFGGLQISTYANNESGRPTALNINSVYAPTAGQQTYGSMSVPTISPVSTANGNSIYAGSMNANVLGNTNFSAGATAQGTYSLGSYGIAGTFGNQYLSSYGTYSEGINVYSASFTVKSAVGVYATGINYWGGGSAFTVNDYSAAFYAANDNISATITNPREFGYYGEKPTKGTANFQMALAGNGAGTGIFLNAAAASSAQTNYARIYSPANSQLRIATDSGGTPTDIMSFYNGLVGIGTTTPESKLQVSGGGLCVDSDANCNTDNNTEGVIYAHTATVTGADYAEYFATKDKDLKSGEVVCVDTENDNAIKRCLNDGDSNVMGIVSSNPSMVGNSDKPRKNNNQNLGYKIIGMIGQIKGYVTNENGNIQIGDSITASSIPGYMRKANAGESTVGVAMQNFTDSKGQIQILISRKNKSLTVDAVETQVTQRIAELNVQDQVNNLISQANTNLQTALASTQDQLNNQGSLLADIQSQIEAIKSKYNLQEGKLTFQETEIESLKLILGINPEKPGDVSIFGKLTAQETETGKLIINVSDEAKKTIGEASISEDKNIEFIETAAAGKEDIKIYITPIGSTENQVIYVGDVDGDGSKHDGKVGFEVKVDRLKSIAETDAKAIKFNWWIVGVDK